MDRLCCSDASRRRLQVVRDRLADQGATPLAIRRDGRVLGMIELKDTIKEGLVERFGPRMAPIEGRGDERLDLRLYPIDPLDRSFWPFPDSAVTVDEAKRPPGPGEEPGGAAGGQGRVARGSEARAT